MGFNAVYLYAFPPIYCYLQLELFADQKHSEILLAKSGVTSAIYKYDAGTKCHSANSFF